MAQVSKKTIATITNSSEIVKSLFDAELTRIDGMLDRIIAKNEEATNIFNTAGFLYMGEFYRHSKANSIPTHGNRIPLDSSLIPMMLEYLGASALILEEASKINQMVFRLVQGCTTKEDVRDVLPECLIAQDKVHGFASMPRTRKSAFTIEGDARAQRQYAMVLPLIEYYAGSHLLI